jgi:hypothetical protein
LKKNAGDIPDTPVDELPSQAKTSNCNIEIPMAIYATAMNDTSIFCRIFPNDLLRKHILLCGIYCPAVIFVYSTGR